MSMCKPHNSMRMSFPESSTRSYAQDACEPEGFRHRSVALAIAIVTLDYNVRCVYTTLIVIYVPWQPMMCAFAWPVVCPLHRDSIRLLTNQGHVYCRRCILTWARKYESWETRCAGLVVCPTCKAPTRTSKLLRDSSIVRPGFIETSVLL